MNSEETGTNICTRAFDTLIIGGQGWTAPCCGGWLDSGGAVTNPHDGPWGIWNDARLIVLRQSILDNDYRFCRRCPHLKQRTFFRPREGGHEPTMQRLPRRLEFADDASCNLHCWSCREKTVIHQPTDDQRRRFWEWIDAAHIDAEPERPITLSMAHAGDPFASPLYLEFLKSFQPWLHPGIRIALFTNGLLIPKHWPEVSHLASRIVEIQQSIDAADPETYVKLRRGGQWSHLVASLQLIRGLRLEHPQMRWIWRFVVQSDNFRQMPAFVRWAIGYGGVTSVVFAMLRQWELPEAEYRKHDLTRPDHPNRKEFLRILKSPILRDPIVAPGVFRVGTHELVQIGRT